MKGNIRTKEKCPKCKGKFEGNTLHCLACLTTPKRYYIDIFWQKQIKIYSDRQGHPLDSFQRAARVLEAVRYEIDNHTFDPSKYIKADLKSFLFETQIETWYQSKKNEVEKGNIASSYTRGLRCFIDRYYLKFFKGMDIRDIKTFYIQQFYEQLPSDKSLKYISNIMKALENFFNTLYRLDLIDRKPSFPIITLDRKTPRWIDRETQAAIFELIPDGHLPIFTFLTFQGVRPGEARALKAKDIDFKNESITVSRTFSERIMRERVKSKVVKPRALNPALVPMLDELCRDKHPEAFVFVNPRTGRHYTENAIRRVWKKVKKSLEMKGLNLTVTPYQATRHSWASNALKDGVPLTVVQKILGHTDIRTTLKYADTDLEVQRVAFKKEVTIAHLQPKSSPLKKIEEKS